MFNVKRNDDTSEWYIVHGILTVSIKLYLLTVIMIRNSEPETTLTEVRAGLCMNTILIMYSNHDYSSPDTNHNHDRIVTD